MKFYDYNPRIHAGSMKYIRMNQITFKDEFAEMQKQIDVLKAEIVELKKPAIEKPKQIRKSKELK